MALTQQVTCDVCGKQKGAVNHWWMLKKHELLPHFEMFPWDDMLKENQNYGHLCGQECATKKLSEWMQK